MITNIPRKISFTPQPRPPHARCRFLLSFSQVMATKMGGLPRAYSSPPCGTRRISIPQPLLPALGGRDLEVYYSRLGERFRDGLPMWNTPDNFSQEPR